VANAAPEPSATAGEEIAVRLDGVDGSIHANLVYRWTPTPEDKFLAEIGRKRTASTIDKTATVERLELETGDWPGFRGPDRDARLAGVRLVADWDKHPPRQVWRHRVGPGWSSFAVVGNRLYTQEQLGEDEAVICYDTASGGELWIHRDAARFTETMAGPGPRATPTFHEGNIYALGATGRLNCLDAATGSVVWKRDIAADSGAKTPIWGFSSSPLIASGIVTIFAGGPGEKAVLGYSAESGEPAWSAGKGEHSYCSTQLSRLDDVEQLVISTDQGLTAFDPARGKVLWNYSWPLDGGMSRVVQPAIAGDSEVLIGTGFGEGTRRVQLTHAGDSWTARDIWPAPSRAIRPYYNDLVIHQGHIYGFDNNFFTCVSLEDGKGKWKARGYGNGQVRIKPEWQKYYTTLLELRERGPNVFGETFVEIAHHRGLLRHIQPLHLQVTRALLVFLALKRGRIIVRQRLPRIRSVGQCPKVPRRDICLAACTTILRQVISVAVIYLRIRIVIRITVRGLIRVPP
jgi:outer membrane protein assembly factor BamB